MYTDRARANGVLLEIDVSGPTATFVTEKKLSNITVTNPSIPDFPATSLLT